MTPVEVIAPEGARILEIVWDDGVRSAIKHRHLRAFCPCALCQGHDGPIRWTDGAEALGDAALTLKDIEPMGAYALRMDWADGHYTGIFPYTHLRALGELFTRGDEELMELVFERGAR